jgi:formylglycine-generating enzyme required for sulfatase activity
MNTPSFTNRSGRVVMLDAVPLGKGGQAVVYRLRDDPRSVAKIFNPPLTREAWEARKKENHFDSYEAYLDNFWKKRRETEEKLKFMVAHPTPELLEFTAWPTDLLHENGKLQGYVMPFIDGARELHEFSNPSARRSKFEKQKPTWQHAVVSAINLARAFAALHECGHVVGDGKPQNVLLNANGTLRVVDCDSFQIDLGGGRILPCPVDSSEYCPPELRKADPAPRTANHDNFQLAAMLFELLYEGNKPYACIPPDGVSDEVSKPGEGNRHFYYPYDEANARATGCKPPLRPFPPDALLPDFIMRLFAQAFTERGVKKRPTAAEWRRALEELNDGIVNCEAGAHKVYQAFRSACPFCLREQKKARGASTPPPMPGASASARASSAPPPLPGASASAGASSTPPPLPGASASTGASSTPPPLPSTRGSKSAIRNFWIVVVVASLALGGFGFSEYRKLEREKETSAPTPPPQAAPTSPSESAANPPASAARERITNIIGMEFVLIPAGSFTMGDDGESADDDEKPRHRVTISQPFYLGKYEVTQMQWAVVMGNNPSRFKELSNPVENVSWNDVQEFIRRLNQMLLGARKYRLPTEAEWEYAARAGTTSAYSFGDDAGNLYRYAWYKGNSEDKTHPVGQRDPNAWGLHDMHGNVWEWVEDW